MLSRIEPGRHRAEQGFADAIAKRLLQLSTKRVWKDRAPEWREAYDERREGSTFRRARIIGSRVFDPAAPIPVCVPKIRFGVDAASGRRKLAS
jgi:hypothetical protein